MIRTVQLLRYLSDPPLRRRVTAATNKVESFNRFSQWIGFGNRGVIADNDPVEQEKAMKFNTLLANLVVSLTTGTHSLAAAGALQVRHGREGVRRAGMRWPLIRPRAREAG